MNICSANAKTWEDFKPNMPDDFQFKVPTPVAYYTPILLFLKWNIQKVSHANLPLMTLKWFKCNYTPSFLISRLGYVNMLIWPQCRSQSVKTWPEPAGSCRFWVTSAGLSTWFIFAHNGGSHLAQSGLDTDACRVQVSSFSFLTSWVGFRQWTALRASLY